MIERVVVIHRVDNPTICQAVSRAFWDNDKEISLDQLFKLQAAEKPIPFSIIFNDDVVSRYKSPENRIYPIDPNNLIHEGTQIV